MGNTFNLVITGRKAHYVAVDPKTQQYIPAVDTTPQVMQYLDKRHAFMDAPKLAGLSAANANAIVEVRPSDLHDDAPGVKLPLAEWIEGCKNSPLPPAAGNRPVKQKFISQIDQLLSEQVPEPAPTVAPVPPASIKTPEPAKVDAVADVAAAAAK